MRSSSSSFALLVSLGSLAAAACGGQVGDPIGGTTLPSTDGHHQTPAPQPGPAPTATGTAIAVPTPPPSPPAASATCATAKPTPNQPTSFPSIAALRTALTRTWVHCGGAGPFTPGGPATRNGFQITQDGHYYGIQANAAGQLVRQTGFDGEGVIDILDNGNIDGPGVYQINFDPGSGGFAPEFAAFSTDGSTLSFTDESGGSTFVATSDDVIVPPLASSDGARLGAAGCAIEEAHTQTTYTSQADAQAHVVGRWVTCASTSPWGASSFGPPGNVGLEIAPDGHFYFLQASGTDYVRGDYGPGYTGTWSVFDGSPTHSGNYQLNLAAEQGGTWILLPASSNAPVKLHVDDEGQQVTYSALP